MDPISITGFALGGTKTVVNAAVQLKKIYDAFFDQQRNSTVEARDFAQLVSTFAINLINQERLISRAGKFFPGEENFMRTIDQCETYLRDYANLLKEKAHPVRRAIEITKWAADLAGDRTMLIDKLNIHVNSMNSFSMNVLLEIALRDREAIRPFPTDAEVPVADEDPTLLRFRTQYNKLYDQIVMLQYRQKRDKRYDRMPDLVMTELKEIISDWREILVESGVSADKLPKAPNNSEHDTFENTMQRWRRDIYLELSIGERSLHSRSPTSSSRSSPGARDAITPHTIIDTPADRPSASRRTSQQSIQSTSTSRRPSLQSPRASFPKPSPHPEQDVHHSPIDEHIFAQGSPFLQHAGRSPSVASTHIPSIFEKSPTPTWHTSHTMESQSSRRKSSRTSTLSDDIQRLSLTGTKPIAELKWDRHTVALHTYDVEETKKGRIVVWNKGTDHQLDHVLGKSVHPFTKHSSIDKPRDVCFLEANEVIYHKKSYSTSLTYTFGDVIESKAFQSQACNRQLLASLDVEKITTATSGKRGEATDQHVKLWKSNASDNHYLTYYANALSPQKHRTLRLAWFDRPSAADRAKSNTTTVRLALKKPATSPGAPTRRLSSISSISGISFPKPRSPSISASTSPTIDSSRQRTSMFGDGSVGGEGRGAGGGGDDQGPREDIAKLGYLEIEFLRAIERHDFVDAIVRGMDGRLSAGSSPKIPEAEPPDVGGPVPFASRRATPSSLLGIRVPL